jgi:hypothetical protein
MILKSWLKLPAFSATSIVLAFAECPPLKHRQRLLRHRRQKKIRGRWLGEWWPDFVLIRVRNGCLGESWVEIPELFLHADSKWSLAAWFYEPNDEELQKRSGGVICHKLLTKLQKLKLSFGLKKFTIISCFVFHFQLQSIVFQRNPIGC